MLVGTLPTLICWSLIKHKSGQCEFQQHCGLNNPQFWIPVRTFLPEGVSRRQRFLVEDIQDGLSEAAGLQGLEDVSLRCDVAATDVDEDRSYSKRGLDGSYIV